MFDGTIRYAHFDNGSNIRPTPAKMFHVKHQNRRKIMAGKNQVVMATTEIDVLEGIVGQAMDGMKKSAFALAPAIYELQLGNAHIARGYSNFADYCAGHFGIGKSTSKNLLAIAKRFSDVKNGHYAISDKWQDYGFAKLQLIKSMSNEDIEQAGITPAMTLQEIQRLANVKKIATTEQVSEQEATKEAKQEATKEATKEAQAIKPVTLKLDDLLNAITTKDKATKENMTKWLRENVAKGITIVM